MNDLIIFYKLKRMSKYFLSLSFLLLAAVLSGKDNYKPISNTAEFKSKLAEMVTLTNTMTCDFIQEKNLVVLSEKIISKGKLYFKKENNIRWEYTDPLRYLIIINQDKIFIRDDNTRKQYDIKSNKMFKELNKFIMGCIQGDILKNDKEYAIEYFENSKQYYVKLIPRAEKMRQMLNELQIWFKKDDLTISSLKMVESDDDYTKIDFFNKKMNSDIPLEKFNFK